MTRDGNVIFFHHFNGTWHGLIGTIGTSKNKNIATDSHKNIKVRKFYEQSEKFQCRLQGKHQHRKDGYRSNTIRDRLYCISIIGCTHLVPNYVFYFSLKCKENK